MDHTRQIVIGQVERKYVQIRNAGYPGGLSMRWTGRVDWCQPCEFLNWNGLLWAIHHRLGLAGLEPVWILPAREESRHGCPLDPGEWELRVVVRRASRSPRG